MKVTRGQYLDLTSETKNMNSSMSPNFLDALNCEVPILEKTKLV